MQLNKVHNEQGLREASFSPKGRKSRINMRTIACLVVTVLLISLCSGCGASGSGDAGVDTSPPAASDRESTATSEGVERNTPAEPQTEIKGNVPVVYMTTDISPEGLVAVYEALGREATGKVAVKLHTGEPGGHNFLSPNLIKDLVQSIDGTIVESNTAGGFGRRASTAMHLEVVKEHGFTDIAPVVILDSDGEISLPVQNGKHLTEDIVGVYFQDFDFHVVLSHFKGHEMGGFGGAIKNMSIGYASSRGKELIHNAGAPGELSWDTDQDSFLESMAEAAKAVADSAGNNILYISVMNNLSVDCDCSDNPAAPELHDIGILASLDPVALDRACVDQIYLADDKDSASLRERIEARNGTHTLDYAAEIGLGRLEYELVNIDS